MARSERRSEIERYYAAVAPFYVAEMAARGDVAEWVALARTLAPRRVLDLGCGGGRVGAAIAEALKGADVVGLDLQRALLRDSAPIRFVQGDMRRLPFRDGSFDLVAAANDPFAHLLTDDERVAAVEEARRVLAPGGRAVVDGARLTEAEARVAEVGELQRERRTPQGLVVRERWHRDGDGVYRVCFEYRSVATVGEACAPIRPWRLGEPALAGALSLAADLAGSPAPAEGDRLVITVAAP